MKNLINQLGVGEVFSLNAITTVEELANHDMIYIYHHLTVGSKLTLTFDEETLQGDLRYAATFRGFLIGYVRVSGVLTSFYRDRKEVTAEIVGCSKDRYMPLKQLDVQLQLNAMKKAG